MRRGLVYLFRAYLQVHQRVKQETGGEIEITGIYLYILPTS